MAKPPAYERKALEKIWNVLQEIEERRLFSPENRDLRMFFIPPGFGGTRLALDHVIEERSAIMEKLQSLGAIIIIQTVSGLDGGWVFKTGPKYKRVFSDYEKKYGHAAGLYEETKEAEQEKKRIEQAGIGSIGFSA